MLRKNWSALGSFLKEDRPRALDLLGFASQLVFNTFLNKYLLRRRARPRPRLRLRPGARPQPRHGRLLLRRPAPARGRLRAARRLRARARDGARRRSRWAARRCSSRRPARRRTRRATSASSRSGRVAQEAGLPIVFHVGGGGRLLDPQLLRERPAAGPRLPRRRRELPLGRLHGDPVPADADAGDDDHRRRPRPLPAPQGRRHRAGRGRGLPSWMRQLDVGARGVRARARSACASSRSGRASTCAARSASRRTRPSRSAGSSSRPAPEVCLFSSDYPHVEGGRNPIKRFEDSLAGDRGETRSSASTATTSST